MKTYDFILVGGGLAGLSLALHLVKGPLGAGRLLIIDREESSWGQRTFSFWSECSTLFDNLIYRSWSQLLVVDDRAETLVPLGNYRYNSLRGSDLQRFARQALQEKGRVDFYRGSVECIRDGETEAQVSTGDERFAADWVFDSRFRLTDFHPDSRRYHSLQQHFVGWEVETTEPAFDLDTPIFLDFRSTEHRGLAFFYLLPFSERHALVESVRVSRDGIEQGLQNYLQDILGIREYRILRREGGVTPLSDYPFPRRAGRRILRIGVPAGMVKPTTGYAFSRIQKDSQAIVTSLLRQGHPFDLPDAPYFYRLCDTLMLQVFLRHSERVPALFASLFHRNPARRVLRFMDEVASPWENFSLIASLAHPLFLKAWLRVKILRQI